MPFVFRRGPSLQSKKFECVLRNLGKKCMPDTFEIMMQKERERLPKLREDAEARLQKRTRKLQTSIARLKS